MRSQVPPCHEMAAVIASVENEAQRFKQDIFKQDIDENPRTNVFAPRSEVGFKIGYN